MVRYARFCVASLRPGTAPHHRYAQPVPAADSAAPAPSMSSTPRARPAAVSPRALSPGTGSVRPSSPENAGHLRGGGFADVRFTVTDAAHPAMSDIDARVCVSALGDGGRWRHCSDCYEVTDTAAGAWSCRLLAPGARQTMCVIIVCTVEHYAIHTGLSLKLVGSYDQRACVTSSLNRGWRPGQTADCSAPNLCRPRFCSKGSTVTSALARPGRTFDC